MLEHVSIPISNYKRSVRFYSAALKSLGYRLYRKYPPEAAGYLVRRAYKPVDRKERKKDSADARGAFGEK